MKCLSSFPLGLTSLLCLCAGFFAQVTSAQVLYVAGDDAGNGHLHTVNANGTGDAVIPLSFAGHNFAAIVFPQWAHDSGQYAISAVDPTRSSQLSINVFAATPGTKATSKITNFVDAVGPNAGEFTYVQGLFKAFSPNRSRIAVSSLIVSGATNVTPSRTPYLQIYSVDGSTQPALVNLGNPRDGFHYEGEGVDWSPTQNVIVSPLKHDLAFPSGSGTGETTALFLITPVDGAVEKGQTRQITSPKTDVIISNFQAEIYSEHDYSPRFSPDGTRVAFVRAFEVSVTSGTQPYIESLHIVNVNTGVDSTVTTLTQGMYVNNLDWSPDGTQLVFDAGQQIITGGSAAQGSQPATVRLYVINTNGQGLHQLRGANSAQPAWRPKVPTPPVAAPVFGNISTRADVLTGANIAIGGFIVNGTGNKRVLVRGIGPSLAKVGITGALPDPVLELHRTANGKDSVIATNDNWKTSQQSAIQATGLAPADAQEAAILSTLTPGSYTAILHGKGSATGTGLIEIYDLAVDTGATLANISTRAFVGTDNNALIGGFIVSGSAEKLIVRAIGPSLAKVGISAALMDPTLELRNANGVLLASNDNWKTSQQAAIQASGLAPSDARESAIVTTLKPGSYTAIVRGKNNTTGVGLVEAYQMK